MEVCKLSEITELKNERVSRCKGRPESIDIKEVKFCFECGKKLASNENKCPVCNGKEFVEGKFAERLAGYLKLKDEGVLKKYFKERDGNRSVIRMNDKRVLVTLMIKDGFIRDNENSMVDFIYRTTWKKFRQRIFYRAVVVKKPEENNGNHSPKVLVKVGKK